MATRFLIDSKPCPVQFECGTVQGRVLQNVKNLLMTHMGDVPYDRLRGLNPDVYDKPLPFVKAHITEEIARVLAWEPDVKLIKVDIQQEKVGTVFVCEVEVPEEPEGRATFK
jgi:phage baseplate assembly protein W